MLFFFFFGTILGGDSILFLREKEVRMAMARVISFSQEMMVRELALYSIVARRVAPKKGFFGVWVQLLRKRFSQIAPPPPPGQKGEN